MFPLHFNIIKMPTWKPIVGLSFQTDGFRTYCQSLHWTSWRPSFIVLHNTGVPALADCPNGITKNTIDGFVNYYRDEKHWSAGPHLFVDDHQIWVFTPLTTTGVHAPSWNAISLGVEMLGNYDNDLFDSGRGQLVQQNAVAAIAILSGVLGLDPKTMKLHKEDPKTTHKDCPGRNVDKAKFINEVIAGVQAEHIGEHTFELNLKNPQLS